MERTAEHSREAGPRVGDLVAERDRLRSWLDRLDDLDETTPQHIAARVRKDYGERLEEVAAQLTEHIQVVRDDLKNARERLSHAEDAYREALDGLEEVRLRHRIGELDSDSWEEKRPALESARDRAEEARHGLAGEVEALEALLLEIETPSQASPAGGSVPPAGEPSPEPEEWEPVIEGAEEDESDDDFDAAFNAFAEEDHAGGAAPTGTREEEEDEDVALPWLSEIDEEIDRATRPARERDPDEGDAVDDLTPTGGAQEDEDDLAFLAELDRAIAASEERPPLERPEREESEEGKEDGTAGGDARIATIPCPECGAANDPRSWYCEVCAAELG